jgi:hypothetical protein
MIVKLLIAVVKSGLITSVTVPTNLIKQILGWKVRCQQLLYM